MPATAIFLTTDEYNGIMDRLAALEIAAAARVVDLAPIQARLQTVESTMSAYAKTMASLPSILDRITVLEKKLAELSTPTKDIATP